MTFEEIRRNWMSNLVRHMIARGRVQGVGYRAFVADEAFGHGIAGWVRNRHDGTVEAVFSGPPEAVGAVIAACRRGPWGAEVSGLEVRDGTADELAPGPDTFSVLPTL
jgi:acylphosphatase